MSISALARPEIAALHGYSIPTPGAADVRLNANEAFCSPWADGDLAELNRYPEMRPRKLRQQLAAHFDVPESNLFPTRGSSEGIDTLIRVFCRAYQDRILITPPTFEMYGVYAAIQGAGVSSVPLRQRENFRFELGPIIEACSPETKLIILASPNNPTGNELDRQFVLDLCEARHDQSMILIDEAYIEFSDRDSFAADATRVENLVVLRTLSKAYALAGARCGVVIGSTELIDLLDPVLSPYSFATPVIERIEQALSSGQQDNARRLINEVIVQRELMFDKLGSLGIVDTVWPGKGNFLLVRFHNLRRVHERLHEDAIRIREFVDVPELEGCARITIGAPEENEQLIRSLASLGVAHG